VEITNLELSRLVGCLLLSGIINLFFLRKHLFGIFDPWVIVFIEQTTILGVLAYYTWGGKMLPEHFVYVLFGYLFLILGMHTFYKKRFWPLRSSTLLSSASLPVAISILLCITVANVLVIYYLLGAQAFYRAGRNITLYSTLGRGGGLFYYLNTGLMIFLPVLAMKALLMYKHKRLAYFSLFVLAMVMLGLGGKGGFLRLLFAYGVSMYYLNRHSKKSVEMSKTAWVVVVILGVTVLFSFVGVAEMGYESSAIRAFAKRMMNNAAGPFYYFVRHSYLGFSGLNVLSYHFSQITPYLGFRDLEAIYLGVNLTLRSDEAVGTPGYGPVPSLYVIGHIAWGYAGVFYCFVLGAILSFIRYRLKASFIVYVILNLLAVSLLSDGTLMPLYVLYALVLSPLVLIAVVIVKGSQKQGSVRGLSHAETGYMAMGVH
jgi:oligosaccharide repeat unit polymerase